jgi:hypothetical protein
MYKALTELAKTVLTYKVSQSKRDFNLPFESGVEVAGKNLDRILERFRESFKEKRQVEVDDSVVQEFLVGQRLIIVRRHAVTMEFAKPVVNGMEKIVLETHLNIIKWKFKYITKIKMF